MSKLKPRKVSNLFRVTQRVGGPARMQEVGLWIHLLSVDCTWMWLVRQGAWCSYWALSRPEREKFCFKVYTFNRFFQEMNISFTETSILDTILLWTSKQNKPTNHCRRNQDTVLINLRIPDDSWMDRIPLWLCDFFPVTRGGRFSCFCLPSDSSPFADVSGQNVQSFAHCWVSSFLMSPEAVG